jgi:hypothetical protein
MKKILQEQTMLTISFLGFMMIADPSIYSAVCIPTLWSKACASLQFLLALVSH